MMVICGISLAITLKNVLIIIIFVRNVQQPPLSQHLLITYGHH